VLHYFKCSINNFAKKDLFLLARTEPNGNSTHFVGLNGHDKKRSRISLWTAINVLHLGHLLFFGEYVLSFFGISEKHSIAGGIIIATSGFSLLTGFQEEKG
jgi:small neutral amino acid transporter SnatA (MarC family)